jgi:probable F420-dependent oxidoreductase
MQVDITLPSRIREGLTAAQSADGSCDGIGWVSETSSDPTVVAAALLAATSDLRVGTGVCVAFARSPFVLAQAAWELARASEGRFVLGLGTQVKAHLARRFNVPAERPLDRMRDYVGALRAIWNSFQTGARLQHEGRYYRHTLLTDYFNPGPIAHPDIPVFLAGVNPRMVSLVGEVAQGLFAHPLHSRRYLADVVAPALQAGLSVSGRSRDDVQVLVPVWVVTGRDDTETAAAREAIRAQIAFYGATRTYRGVFEVHGWGDVPPQLHAMLAGGDRPAMLRLITDEMVETFAVCANPDAVPRAVAARLTGVADRVLLYDPVPDGLHGGHLLTGAES